MGGLENAASESKNSNSVTKNSSSVTNDTQNSISLTNGTEKTLSPDSTLNLEVGDPTMFEAYWGKMGEKCTVVISGSDLMSYFSDVGNVCWFLVPELDDAIKRLHRTVGNAVPDNRYVVVGTGSTQLFQAALYALCSTGGPHPVSIICAAPYYLAYKDVTECLRSELYKWGGDANAFDKNNGPFIEIITSPNNPDGAIRETLVSPAAGQGKYIHDLAYYWPHYTSITAPADYDLMLFTFSKSTGHAGSRIGWALVKDKEVARMMTKFIKISSIGVSKESQLRAAKILGVVAESCRQFGTGDTENFFQHGRCLMAERWMKLTNVIENSKIFSLPAYPRPQRWCNFTGKYTESHPAFAWLKCKKDGDLEKLLRAHKIQTKGGELFGVSRDYVRISMLSREEMFNLFLERLSAIQGIGYDNHM